MALPIQEFLIEKIQEYNNLFDLRKGTAFRELFIKPSEIILQPFRDELDNIELNQSILNVLESEDPDAYDEDVVDALISNVFVARKTGNKTVGVVRVRFYDPRGLDLSEGTAAFLDSAGNRYLNTANVNLTVAEMGLNLDSEGYYYTDINVEAESEGQIEVGADEIVTWEDGPTDLANVTNVDPFTVGADRETNTELIERARNSIAVRDLVTRKGIYATLFENFDTIEELQVIGFGDPEQQRDIIYNTHIGGRVDIYIKTPVLYEGSFDISGILTDTTRRKHHFTNISLSGTVGLGTPSIDRTDFVPLVTEIADPIAAIFTSTVDLAGGIDLSTVYNIKLTITESDGTTQTNQIGLAGAVPANTNRTEIINKINSVVGYSLCSAYDVGPSQYIRFTTQTKGATAQIRFTAPTTADCSFEVFGLNEALYPHDFNGIDPTVYTENIDYTLDDADGEITRIPGGAITDGQFVNVEYDYNPLSIDVGKPVRQDDGTYAIRTGRDTYTITDVPFMYIDSIEILDPVSGEATGEVLDAIGGYGQGGYGQGGFGIGEGSDYRLVVVDSHKRYSVLEECYIEINPNYIGMDLRVNYHYAREIQSIHDFVVSENERVVAADLLVKHFIPVLIDFDINYQVKQSQVNSIKTNEELTDIVGEAVNDSPSGKRLEASDFVNLIYENGAVFVDLPFTIYGDIFHVDGTIEKIRGQNYLEIQEVELESDTDRPISPRITHLIPRTVTLNRTIITG